MSLTTNESVGASARLGVLRLGASRLGAVVTEGNLDKDLDGTYGWKRRDTGDGVREGEPPTNAANSGWSVSRGGDYS